MSDEKPPEAKPQKKQAGINLLGPDDAPAPPAPKPPVAVSKERLFKVLERIEVPSGASSYLLHAGQSVSSFGYDIEDLRTKGVKLEEIKPAG
jgi:hypothetical protein